MVISNSTSLCYSFEVEKILLAFWSMSKWWQCSCLVQTQRHISTTNSWLCLQDKPATRCTNTSLTARWTRCCRTCHGEQRRTAPSWWSWPRRSSCWRRSCGGASLMARYSTSRKGTTYLLALGITDVQGSGGGCECCCGIEHIFITVVSLASSYILQCNLCEVQRSFTRY